MDGTILNTLPDLASALNKTLSQLDLPGHSLEFYRKAIGSGAKDHVRNSLPFELKNDAPFLERAFDLYCSIYAKEWRCETKLYPQVDELLDRLVQLKIPLAILTNKPQEFTDEMVKVFFSKWPFSFTLGAVEGIPRKPHPQQALRIIQEWNLLPQQVAMVGDSDIDMIVAKKCGMVAIGVNWGFREESELWENGAHRVLSHPLELLSLLTGL